MKLKSIEYLDLISKWHLNEFIIDPKLSLLVGISGVGKTQILKTIIHLKNLLNGKMIFGANWKVVLIDNGNEYIWKGSSENPDIHVKIDGSEDFEFNYNARIRYEEFLVNNQSYYHRERDTIKYRDRDLPTTFNVTESALKIFSEDEHFKKVISFFNNIIYFSSITTLPSSANTIKFNSIINLEDLRNAKSHIFHKLAFVYESKMSVFNNIKEEFISIFSFIQDIRFREIEKRKYVFEIKEENSKWIQQSNISSGMIKTLFHICSLYLLPLNSLLLIDEYENSLGINCIDSVSSSLMNTELKIQIIITSHHPYIINNISIQNWKIVTRDGNEVHIYPASKFELERSRHESFKKLINLETYLEGIK